MMLICENDWLNVGSSRFISSETLLLWRLRQEKWSLQFWRFFVVDLLKKSCGTSKREQEFLRNSTTSLKLNTKLCHEQLHIFPNVFFRRGRAEQIRGMIGHDHFATTILVPLLSHSPQR